MKKTMLTLALVLVHYLNFAQAPALLWQKVMGGTNDDQANCIQPTPDGGYIMAGTAKSTDGDLTGSGTGTAIHTDNDFWIVKLSVTGVKEWQKIYGGLSYDQANSIQPTSDGGYIVAGYTQYSSGDVTGGHGDYDAWVVKLSATGDLLWQKALGGTNDDRANSVQPTPDGGYIVAGFTSSVNGNVTGNHGNYDAWVMKLSDTGVLVWQKALGGSQEDDANSIQNTPDGGFIVAGYTYSSNGNVSGNHGDIDAWVMKLDATGGLAWQKTLGGTGKDQARSIQPTSDGGYIMAGFTSSTNGDVTGNHGGPFDAWVVKLSASAVIEWQKTYGGTNFDQARSLELTPDGGYIVGGYTSSFNGDVTGAHAIDGSYDAWVLKLTATGTLTWQKALGGTGQEQAQSIQLTPDGGYIIAGTTASNINTSSNGDVSGYHGPAGTNDAWIVKIGGNSIPVVKIKANQCGTTLTSLTANINADYVPGYEAYRFKVSNGTTVNTIDVNKYNFSLTQTPGITYGITYGVRVAVKMGGVWGAYGSSCNVTTPTLTSNIIPTTTIMPSFCGTTLAALDTKIGAVLVYGATKGRFEVTIAGGSPVVYEVAAYNFKLSQTGVAVQYSTNYSIRVAAFVGGVWGNYGSSCTVTTPAAPIQYTTIPDPVFEARLISLGLDSGAIDHKVKTSNIASVTSLNVGDSTVSNLTGIRDFTSLQTLNCFNSNLTALDVSGLTNLQFISSYQDYSLTNVNLAGCTALNSINFGGCPLTSISFAGLTAMSQIDMNSFNISAIDLSSCHNLTYIQIYSDALHKLNLSGLTNMSNLQMYLGGGNITCIQVDDVATAEQLSLDSSGMGMAQWYKPAGASYSTNCGFTQLLKLSNTNNSFAVKAYPNPYDTAFNLNLETTSKENVTVAVYNMMGTLVESHHVNPLEVANLQLGSNFATGIYNVIVSQANEMQAIRLIRR